MAYKEVGCENVDLTVWGQF